MFFSCSFAFGTSSVYSRFRYCFFLNDTSTTEIYTLSLHDALPIWDRPGGARHRQVARLGDRHRLRRQHPAAGHRSEEHTSELQSPDHLVCRLLLEKKKVSNN